MQSALEDALDKLVSPRSSLKSQADALSAIEWELANTLSASGETEKANFYSLQDTFQCNIASRTLAWLARHAVTLKPHSEEKINGVNQKSEDELTAVVVQALSILQGVSFLHNPSKEYLGRRGSQEVLLDLLSSYRHASTKSLANSTNTDSPRRSSYDGNLDQALAVAVLDTLLCILVDSSTAMRVFESVRGVEQLVKVLKRSAIPKDVRMKCLEFIYFYLMNESPSEEACEQQPGTITPPSPTRSSRSDFSSWSSSTSRVTTSCSAMESLHAPDRTASTTSLSPTPTLTGTPPMTPTKTSGGFFSSKKRHQVDNTSAPLEMLRKEVDFVPISPKKAQIAGLGFGGRRPGAFPIANRNLRLPSPLSRTASEDTLLDSERSVDDDDTYGPSRNGSITMRTTEEKKEHLGHLLGNVDALIEGIRTAGIWGLAN